MKINILKINVEIALSALKTKTRKPELHPALIH